MYETIDSSGKPVIIYENDLAKLKLDDLPFKTSGPIYESKNSHKRTNKRKKR